MAETKKEKLESLIVYNEAGELRKVEELLEELEFPWPNSAIAPAVNVVMQYCTEDKMDEFHKLVSGYGEKFRHKFHFYKQLQQKLIYQTHMNWKQARTEKALLPFNYIIENQQNFNPPAIKLLGLCEQYLRLEKYEKALEVLNKFAGRFNEHKELKDWLYIVANSFNGGSFEQADNMFIPDQTFLNNSVLHYKFGEDKCLVWFGGIVLYPMARLFKHLLVLLKKYNISLLIVLDKRFTASIWGIGESFPYRKKTIGDLNILTDQLNYQHLATYGSSGGGLAALMYGLEMDVQGVFGINVLTHTPKNKVRESKNIADIHRKVILENANELEDVDCLSLVKINKHTKTMLLYSKNSVIDVDYNKRLEGFSNVILKPEEHNKHVMYEYLEENNLLDKRFEKFFQFIGWNEDVSIENN